MSPCDELPRELHRRRRGRRRRAARAAECPSAPTRSGMHASASERQEPRLPAERDCEDRRRRRARRAPRARPRAAVRRRERGREHARAERREAEPGEPVAPRRARRAEARARGTRPGRRAARGRSPDDHRRVVDVAVAPPPSAGTCPRADGARSFSTARRGTPCGAERPVVALRVGRDADAEARPGASR